MENLREVDLVQSRGRKLLLFLLDLRDVVLVPVPTLLLETDNPSPLVALALDLALDRVHLRVPAVVDTLNHLPSGGGGVYLVLVLVPFLVLAQLVVHQVVHVHLPPIGGRGAPDEIVVV
jgi:hypothetical protein